MNGSPTWILVRHGETKWTEKNLLHGGRTDSPLSTRGKAQAELTAKKLAEEKISKVYSSPQGRASETAKYISDLHELSPEYLDGLRELDFGWLEGRPLFDFSEDGHTPKFLRPFIQLIMQVTGEGRRAFYHRIKESVNQIQKENHDSSIVIVTHWGVLSVIAATLIGANVDDWHREAHWAPCGISRIRRENSHWEFVEQDNTDHLKSIGQPS